MDRIEEYDDGYGSKLDFERAGCDTDNDIEPDEENDDES